MPNYCIVPLCKNHGGHRFPKDGELAAKWCVAVKRAYWKPSRNSVVCSSHFTDEDYDASEYTTDGATRLKTVLRRTAVPSVFPWSRPVSECKANRSTRKRNRDTKKEDMEREEGRKHPKTEPILYDGHPNLGIVGDHVIIHSEAEIVETHSESTSCAQTVEDIRHIASPSPGNSHIADTTLQQSNIAFPHSRDTILLDSESEDKVLIDSPQPDVGLGDGETDNIGVMRDDNGVILDDDVEALPPNTTTELPDHLFSPANPEHPRVVDPINKDIFELPYMCIQRLKNTDSDMHRYTSLDSYSRFQTAFWSLGPHVDKLKYVYSKTEDVLCPEDCFLLMCTKLRQNTPVEELARGFSISVFSVTNIFLTWVKFCSRQWGEIDLWPDRHIVDHYFPSDFQAKYKNTRVIIDGTEIPIKKPSNSIAQRASFSQYKHRNTVKVLVGTTPGRLVSFISPVYGGSASDRQIVERSNLKSLCERNDSIMADKGFNVQDIFATKDIHINLPTFFRKKNRMDQNTVERDRKISSKRVHIERTIGMAKVYRILKGPLNAAETILADDIIRVCFMLYNFRDCIVSDTA